MTGRTLTSTLIVRLLEKVTGPARQIGKSLDGITDAARRAGRAGDLVGRLQNAIEKNNRALDRARGRLVDAAAGFGVVAVAIGAPLKAAMEFETILEDIGQKLNKPQAEFAAFGKSIRQMAERTTQSAEAIAGGIDVLAGMGANEADAMTMMRPIGKAATAYRAEIEHLATAGYAALDNLKVPADQFTKALDSMAQAGKAGAFELRDMAQYFPMLTASYQGLGQQGVGAVADLSAALQITRKGAGDASSAATNLNNVLQKINAPQTRKAFGKMGVDLEKELKKAAAAGLTPIEAIAEITNRTLKGDLAKLGDLFQDAQVQQGLRPLIQNIDLYRQIRADAMRAQGVIEEDYARRLETAQGRIDAFRVALGNAKLALGDSLKVSLGDTAAALTPLVRNITKFIDANPRLVGGVTKAVGAFIGLRVAIIGVQYAALLAKGGLLSMVLPFARLGKAARSAAAANIAYQATLAGMGGGKLSGLAKVAAGLRGIALAVPGVAALGSVVNALGAAFAAIGTVIAGVTLPMIAAVAGVAAFVAGVGLLIYKWWEPLKAFFLGFWRGFLEAIAPVAQSIKAAFAPVIEVLGPVVGPILEWLGSVVGKVVGWFRKLVDPISAADERTKAWGEAGVKAGEWVANAIAAVTWPLRTVLELLGKASALFTGLQVKAAKGIGNIASAAYSAISGGDKAAAPPRGGGGRPRSPAIAGARAEGGPVRAGKTYLVGEEGPELWTAPRSGSILPSPETREIIRSLMRGDDGGSPPVVPQPFFSHSAPAQAKPSVINVTNNFTFNGVTDQNEMVRNVSERMKQEVAEAIRGIHADIGVGL